MRRAKLGQRIAVSVQAMMLSILEARNVASGRHQNEDSDEVIHVPGSDSEPEVVAEETVVIAQRVLGLPEIVIFTLTRGAGTVRAFARRASLF